MWYSYWSSWLLPADATHTPSSSSSMSPLMRSVSAEASTAACGGGQMLDNKTSALSLGTCYVLVWNWSMESSFFRQIHLIKKNALAHLNDIWPARIFKIRNLLVNTTRLSMWETKGINNEGMWQSCISWRVTSIQFLFFIEADRNEFSLLFCYDLIYSFKWN